LLLVDPKRRLDSEAALLHPWVSKSESTGSSNLFAKGDGQTAAAGQQSELEDGFSDVHKAMLDFNLDRKLSVPEYLINKFELKKDSTKINKVRCSLVNQPGHFYLTTYDICFLGSLGKKVKIELSQLAEVTKAKRFKMTPGQGHSLHLKDGTGTNFEFNGFGDRDKVCDQIKTQCTTLGTSTKFS